MNKKGKWFLGIGIALCVLFGSSLIYLSISYKPIPEASDYLISDQDVTIDEEKWIEFSPTNKSTLYNTTGFLFYPGGKVDPESYAPLIYSIASKGILSAIIPMPFNLAVFSPSKAQIVIDAHPEITTWIIGGHSLGGSMAANFVYNNPSLIQGLVLLASYPAGSNNLTDFDLDVISIYGSNDLVLSNDIPSTLSSLPVNTTVFEINGGNHAYFGMYGEQKGDGTATITNIEQITLTTNAIFNFTQEILS